jgi:endonuclease YncB( thermonuclease family)
VADCYKIDRYRRLVCTVYVAGKDVGLAQLDAGLAWWSRNYANEQSPQERLEYEIAEKKAYVDRIGLWQEKNPMPPWEWRKAERDGRQFPLNSGMLVSAEIHLGTRTVMEYLFSPVSRTLHEAGREL